MRYFFGCLHFFSFLSHDNENTQLFFICLLFAWVTQELSDPSTMGLTNTPDPTLLGLPGR
jgi:hypothetical protein